jgi:N6-adenosine-specific RNA methylase IME4
MSDNKVKTIKMPKGKFDIVYADPPWRYEFSIGFRDIENHYPTMELQEIKDLNIPSICNDNAVLYLWATAPKLREALEVMKSWGFEYKTHMMWDKEIIGLGWWFRGQHELLLVGVKGKFSPPKYADRISSVFRQRRGKHSEKPFAIYRLIEKWFPNKKCIELFARNPRTRWTSWGYDIDRLNPLI